MDLLSGAITCAGFVWSCRNWSSTQKEAMNSLDELKQRIINCPGCRVCNPNGALAIGAGGTGENEVEMSPACQSNVNETDEENEEIQSQSESEDDSFDPRLSSTMIQPEEPKSFRIPKPIPPNPKGQRSIHNIKKATNEPAKRLGINDKPSQPDCRRTGAPRRKILKIIPSAVDSPSCDQTDQSTALIPPQPVQTTQLTDPTTIGCPPCPLANSCRHCKRGKLTNNSFLNFVRDFRRGRCGQQQKVIVRLAADEWNKKNACEKSQFLKSNIRKRK